MTRLLSLCACLILPSLAFGQSCVTIHHQQNQIVQKVVAVDYSQPFYVAVPVQSYAVPVQHLQVPYYYSAAETYAAKNAIRETIREELRSIVHGKADAPQQLKQAPTKEPVKEAEAKWTIDETTPVELQKELVAAYQGKANCLRCHGAGGQDSGGFKLVAPDAEGNLRLVNQTADKRWKIYGMSSSGAMPPAAANDASKAMESKHLPALLRYATGGQATASK